MKKKEIKDLISRMTLEEKASLCSGQDFWHTKEVARLGVPDFMVSDGPHGLRKQNLEADHMGINESIKAVCFPAGCALAASFDRTLLRNVGEVLGNECQAEDVGVILGPAVNIKRSPLCGRNFEYYSEDPYVATELAGAFIDGVQSKNVGVSIKHFVANNQETRRMTSSSEVDERTLREIYLAAFEGAIKNHKPWTVMCSYNKINGTYAAENKKFLTDVLRNEWGFDGFVVSDWGAVNDRVADLKAGMELQMPAVDGTTDKEIVAAVREGRVEEAVVDQAVERMLTILYRYKENREETAVFDLEADHRKAYEVAKETIVLLKNEGVLPLKETAKVAFIGKYAKDPRYQGGGSSHINSFRVTSALECVEGKETVVYAQGYDDKEDVVDEALLNEAVKTAKEAEVAVIFAGLPDAFESEGFDRNHMRMPQCQNHLIEEVAKVQENVVVVLHNGSPIEMPWISKVKGVVEAYLGGQAIGAAVCDILYGKANPCGKLAETFPIKLEDNPSYLYYIGEKDRVEYREGVFVGYRYYDTKNQEVLFPFGHGLSYTTYSYGNLQLDKQSMKDTEELKVSVDITNTGAMEGKEIVQLYVAKKEKGEIIRPAKELRGFEKVFLAPGETKTVSFTLSKRAFAYYNMQMQDWYVESGTYEILIGKSVEDIVLAGEVGVASTQKYQIHVTMDTPVIDLLEDEEAMEIIRQEFQLESIYDIMKDPDAAEGEASAAAISNEMLVAMIDYLPFRGVASFSGGRITYEMVQKAIDRINQKELIGQ